MEIDANMEIVGLTKIKKATLSLLYKGINVVLRVCPVVQKQN